MTSSNPLNLIQIFGFRSLNETAESNPVVSLRGNRSCGPMKPWNPNFSNDYLDYLGKFEAICETE
jgi:hypothetical protein